MKAIKNMSDFLLGILMLGASLYLLLSSGVVSNVPAGGAGGFFARADVYIKLLAGMLVIVSVLLVVRSINFKRSQAVKQFSLGLNREMVACALSLVVYAFLLPVVGFVISTLLLVFFLVAVFSLKEYKKEKTSMAKEQIIKILARAAIYSVVLVIFLYVVFTKLLQVNLP